MNELDASRPTAWELRNTMLSNCCPLRPVYHHKKLRIDGHLFITVLTYQFVQVIRRTLQDHGIQGRWNSLRNILSVQQRVTASFRRADGGTLHVRKATRPESALAAIYQALAIDPLPGGVKKNCGLIIIFLR